MPAYVGGGSRGENAKDFREMKRLSHVTPAVALLVAGSVAMAAAELSTGSKALEAANAAMHEAMAVEMTGDVDIDFMRTMIPHHEGAVEMAKIVIANGKDPEVRKLAVEVIKAQETEIAFMKTWLERNGAGEGKAGGGEGEDHGALAAGSKIKAPHNPRGLFSRLRLAALSSCDWRRRFRWLPDDTRPSRERS